MIASSYLLSYDGGAKTRVFGYASDWERKNTERDTRVIVHLVHGTWGNLRLPFRRAAPRWHEAGHKFFDGLRKALPQNVILRRFAWGWGANLQSSRSRAARELAAYIRSSPPGVAHVLIGHSHGGNICLQACLDPQIAQRVKTLITLATPFLIFREAKFVHKVSRMGMISTAIIATVAIFYNLLDIEAGFVPFLLLTYSGIAILYIFPFAGNRFIRAAEFAPNEVCVPQNAPCRTLILRSLGDEASAVLAVVAPLTWLITKVISMLEIAWDGAALILRITFSIPGWFIFTSFVIIMSLSNSSLISDIFTFAVIGGSLIVFSSIITLLLIMILRLPLGWDLPIRGYRYFVTAEASPPGVWQVETIVGRATTDLPFAHSRIYNEAETRRRVIEAILTSE